jgi:hypothetical protein
MTDDLQRRVQAARNVFTPELEHELKRGRESGRGFLRDVGWGWVVIVFAALLVAFVFTGKALVGEIPYNK